MCRELIARFNNKLEIPFQEYFKQYIYHKRRCGTADNQLFKRIVIYFGKRNCDGSHDQLKQHGVCKHLVCVEEAAVFGVAAHKEHAAYHRYNNGNGNPEQRDAEIRERKRR